MFHKYRAICLAVMTILLIATLAPQVWAKFTPSVGMEVRKDKRAYVLVNKRKAIEITKANGTLSPEGRAKVVSGRLSSLVVSGFDPGSIWYKQVGKSAHILVGDSLLMIATESDATAKGMSSEKLAETWISNLKKLLCLPPLSAKTDLLLVPLGEKRTLEVESLLSSKVEFSSPDPSIIKMDYQAKPGSLVVTGAALGYTSIILKCEEYSITVQVAVKKYAARAPSIPIKAVVTGRKAPASLITRALEDAIRNSIIVEPGAELSSVKIVSSISNVASGKEIKVPAKVQVVGGEYIPAQLDLNVTVKNTIVPQLPTSWIMYSNEPERVTKYQTLFAGLMSSNEEATRLLYHHQNMLGKKIGFVIDVINLQTTPASLQVVEGIAKPMVDTVIVGYKAGMEFMDSYGDGVGRILEIPAGARRVLVSQPLETPYTASGIMQLHQLSGDPVLVRVRAIPEEQRRDEDPLDTVISASGLTIDKVSLSDHIYPQPEKNIEVTYTAGKPWVFLRIGKYPLKHATQDKQLFGNYGVTYDIKANLENPFEQPQEVEIAFEATAGPASGIFIVDGKEVKLRMLQPPSEERIQKVTVAAGSNKIVSIRTIPLSGSAYPATLIIRPVGTINSISKEKVEPIP